MSSSLLAGVSGLTAAQDLLDVVGNNLSNLNTTGFKSQTPLFSDLLYQTLSPASASTNGSGTNPIQVGYGTMTSTVDTNLSQGALTTTGNPLDAAIQGKGFFVANNGTQNLYTRAGAFNIDAAGYLVDPATGYMIQRVGTVGQASATNPGFQAQGNSDIRIPMGTGIPGKASANVTFTGNLNAQTAVSGTVNTAIEVYDTQGTAHTLSLTFQKQSSNTWNLTASIPAADGTMDSGTVNGITFNPDGSFQGVSGSSSISFTINGMPSPQTVNMNFGTANGFNGLTQFGSATSAGATAQDGYTAGTLTSVSIAQDGTINGLFTNGQTFPLAQLAVATFTNVNGLSRVGQNYYQSTLNSGVPLLSGGQAGNAGSIQGGALESSNVDVSLQFTQLITGQQAYEVNSRSISVNNQVIQDLMTIIR